MRSRIAKRWFLASLLIVIVAGMAFSTGLENVAEAMPRRAIVAAVLFLMAAPLEFRAMWGAVRSPLPALLAIAINAIFLPIVAWFVSHALPHGLAEGMIIAAAVPCTLASAAVWTRRAGGNDVIALFVTMATNLACFIVLPAWLLVLLAAKVDIAPGPMILRLFTIVVLPITAAQFLRNARPFATWASAQKSAFGVIAQIGILSMVLVGAVKSGAQLRALGSQALSPLDWGLMIAGVVGVHLIALAFGYRAALRLRFPKADAIAVAFAGSQKTLMVGLDISIEYAAIFGGLAVLPMVAYHVSQLVVDTVIADRWKAQSDRAG